MSITVTTNVHCEFRGCENSTSNTEPKASVRDARKGAKEDGWSRIDGKDYCQTHKPTRVTALMFPVAQ